MPMSAKRTDVASVKSDVVSDRHIFADLYGGFLIECVEDGAVLYVDAVGDANGVDIAAYDGVEPYRAVASDDDVADDRCVGCDECSFADAGCESP